MGEATWVFCLSHYLIGTESAHYASRTQIRVQRCQHIMQTLASSIYGAKHAAKTNFSHSVIWDIRIGPARRRELLDKGRMIKMVTGTVCISQCVWLQRKSSSRPFLRLPFRTLTYFLPPTFSAYFTAIRAHYLSVSPQIPYVRD